MVVNYAEKNEINIEKYFLTHQIKRNCTPPGATPSLESVILEKKLFIFTLERIDTR